MKTDQNLIDVIAGNSSSYSLRMQALDQIKDESVFKFLAENAQDDWIRLESAVRGKINSSLQELKNHSDERICLEAAIELDDQQRLAEIVLSSQDMLLKEIAANYIDDEEQLRAILETTKVEKDKLMAAFRLGDFSCCRQLISEIKDEHLLFKLAQFLGDNELLRKLAAGASDKVVRRRATEWLKALEDTAEEDID
ncbi:MAG: hypothetical protein JW801_00220 [Bacteroidales bacterium]|nr:hypothetical protein [Bacteroidales bacterium]